MSRERFPRIYELLGSPPKPLSRRAYLKAFEASIAGSPTKLLHFMEIEADLAVLDDVAWAHLRSGVAVRFARRDPEQGWRQAFDILNEAAAYRCLIGLGCNDIAFLPTSGARTPDLQAWAGKSRILCEVKTINISSRDANSCGGMTVCDIETRLTGTFFRKLAGRFRDATDQMQSFCRDETVRQIIYAVLRFDSGLRGGVPVHVEQIKERISAMPPAGIDIILDVKPAFGAGALEPSLPRMILSATDRIWQKL